MPLDIDGMVFADLLARHMRKDRLNDRETAEALLVDTSVINRWRRGKAIPSQDRWVDVARFLGLTKEQIRDAISLQEDQGIDDDEEVSVALRAIDARMASIEATLAALVERTEPAGEQDRRPGRPADAPR